jgi:hypothetical protein
MLPVGYHLGNFFLMFKLFFKYLNKDTKTDYYVKTGVACCLFYNEQTSG